MQDIRKEDRQRVRVCIEPKVLKITMPFRSLCRTIKGLVKNGLEASPPHEEVSMRWFTTAEYLRVEVCDRGTGIEKQMEADRLSQCSSFQWLQHHLEI